MSIELRFNIRRDDFVLTLDTRLPGGGISALFGPSGCGKTTLLNAIGGLDLPDSGEVWIAGQRIDTLDKSTLAEMRLRQIGFVFQAFNLIPVLTARENVELVMQVQGISTTQRLKKSTEILAEVGLDGLENRRPAEMSGGQQQRVAVARALANRPRVLLADEPTASIDPAHQQQVIDLLQTTCRDEQVSLVVVTHAPDVAAQFPVRYRLEDFNRAAAAHAPAAGQSAAAGGQS